MDQQGAELILKWYKELEVRYGQVLHAMPLIAETADVFLPSLSSIILESCSLIDTVFRSGMPSAKADAKFPDYAKHYEPSYNFSGCQSAFYHFPMKLLSPFRGWLDQHGTYQPLRWWQDYNQLKHDRIANFRLSTLMTATKSLCALHQIIAKSPDFVEALTRHNMIRFGTLGRQWCIEVLKGIRVPPDMTVIIESEFFGTPAGKESFKDDSLARPPHWLSNDKDSRFWMYSDSPPF